MRDFKEWEQELLAALQEQPVVEITGVLDRQGYRAARVAKVGEDSWSMNLNFLAWRVETTEVRSDCNLYFRRRGNEAECRTIADSMTVDTLQYVANQPDSIAVRMPPGSTVSETIIRVRGRVILDGLVNIQGDPTGPAAWLEEFIDHGASDEQLQNFMADLQNPITLEHKTFGTFTFERNFGWYTARTKFQRTKVVLQLSAQEQSDAEAAAKVAQELFKNAAAWKKRILNYATDQLLSVKNDDWLDDDETPLTARQFKAALVLESVNASPDGNFTFWYSDGELFGGHGIEISGSLTDGPNDASIQG
jgi:hypothetical protein